VKFSVVQNDATRRKLAAPVWIGAEGNGAPAIKAAGVSARLIWILDDDEGELDLPFLKMLDPRLFFFSAASALCLTSANSAEDGGSRSLLPPLGRNGLGLAIVIAGM